MEKMESLGFNSNSKILLSVIIGLQLVALLRRKESSIHPLILAQQSEPSSVRHENQSAIYRNTTIGSFPVSNFYIKNYDFLFIIYSSLKDPLLKLVQLPICLSYRLKILK